MSKITDMVTQKKKDTRVSVFLDGRFCCGLEKITVLSEGLAIGDEIDTDQLAFIQQKSESATAFDKAAHYLGARMRTEKEIRTYLHLKGYLPSVIDSTVEKLHEYHYLDDAEFCRRYIDFHRVRMGEKKLRQELLRLGVDHFTVEDAMVHLGDQTDEAVLVAEKYLRSHCFDRNKIYGFLYGKGFDYDTIRAAIEGVLEQLNREEEDASESE